VATRPVALCTRSRGTPPSAWFAAVIHDRNEAASPPTIASRPRNTRTSSSASSYGLLSGSKANVPACSRDAVASDTPMVRASAPLVRPSNSAARAAALLTTADRSVWGAVGTAVVTCFS